jgi:hypothetical protein
MSSPTISALSRGNCFSAATAARVKNDMNPSRTPCRS